MDFPPFIRCAKKGEGDLQCREMVVPGKRFCEKHCLELRRRDAIKRGRKLVDGDEGSVSSGGRGKNMRVLSAEMGKRKVFDRSEEREGERMEEDELVVTSDTEFLTRDVVRKGKMMGKGLSFYEIRRGISNLDEGKEVVAKRKTGEKKRFFGEEAKEPASMNRNSSRPSQAEKSSRVGRKQTSLMSNLDEGKDVAAKRKTGEKKRFFGEEGKEPASMNMKSSCPSQAEKSSCVGRKQASLMSNLDEGKEVVAKRKTGEKKRVFGEEVKEPASMNRNSSCPSRDEKSSCVGRKQTSLMSKYKDFRGGAAKSESTDTAPQAMEKKRLMCHQCMHSFEKDVVVCSNCKIKRYCHACLAKWYPEQTKVDVEVACPFCRGNCNCKACLRVFLDFKVSRKELDDRARLRHLLYLLHRALPILRLIDKEHRSEIEVESKIQSIESDFVVVPRTKLDNGERIYCNCCNTSVVDFHRTCANCSYDLCLACCRELREGHEPGVKKSDSAQSPLLVENAGQATNMNGRVNNALTSNNKMVDESCSFSDWRANSDGSIPCPPKDHGGCGNGLLALKRTFKSNWVVKLIGNAERLTNSCHFVDDSASKTCSLCPDNRSSTRVDQFTLALRMAASRKSSHDNFLYCPNAIELGDDDYAHFQKHWRRGEPVIVRGVFERTTGLSWDPMVMWRALREKKIKRFKDDSYAVKAVDCLDWCEVEINIHMFFRGYMEGRIHQDGWPEMLKLKDWPPSSLFAERLPRHCAEFIAALPYKEYTHPVAGILNLASRIPEGRPSPDLGPKTYIAYGFHDELIRGDSVTKLHCDISDAVNVLTHTTQVTMSTWHTKRIKELQKKYEHDDCLYRVVDKTLVRKVEENIEPTKQSAILNSSNTDLDEKTGMSPVAAQDKELDNKTGSNADQSEKILVSGNGKMPKCSSLVAVTGQVKKESQEYVFKECLNNIKSQWPKTTDDLKNNGGYMGISSSEHNLFKDIELTGRHASLDSGNSSEKKMVLKEGINFERGISSLLVMADNLVGRTHLLEGSPNFSNRKSGELNLDEVQPRVESSCSLQIIELNFNNLLNELSRICSTQAAEGLSTSIKHESKPPSNQNSFEIETDTSSRGQVTAASVPKGTDVKSNLDHNYSSEVLHGGAVWDIFRREDVPKLIEYLEKHWKEFRHIKTLPLNSIVHPIHDQTLFLNERHKKQLKEEFNVEPWTFEQYLGEAVFIPAGCPHQVRNRQSCIKVALDFVSPENIGECIRLTEEFRLLPRTHRAKEDKLEVKKMVLYAVSSAVREATELISKA